MKSLIRKAAKRSYSIRKKSYGNTQALALLDKHPNCGNTRTTGTEHLLRAFDHVKGAGAPGCVCECTLNHPKPFWQNVLWCDESKVEYLVMNSKRCNT